jgi:phosphatidylglycerol:prolipoprotein diacylglycerol transferase
MSFHGGLLGVIIGAALYGMRHTLPLLRIGDCLACGVPLALFAGRIGNFINQEHCGRPTDLPWGMVFPQMDNLPRHPSQLYEALAEGLVLFGVLWAALHWSRCAQRPGRLCGLFLGGYGMARIACEYFRTPDISWLGSNGLLTPGQLFSLPLLLAAAGLWLKARAAPQAP